MTRTRSFFSVSTLLASVALIVATVGCGKGKSEAPDLSINSANSSSDDGTSARPEKLEPTQQSDVSPAQPVKNLFPEVSIVTNYGEIRVRLNAEKAPKTVRNFIDNYVSRGFYSKTVFHYVDKGFMIAGGGYATDLKPRPTLTEIRHEGRNGLKNKRGTIAMARHPNYVHSATSQFFFNLVDNESLDYNLKADDKKEVDVEKESAAFGYCVFGEVVSGLAVLDKIAEVDVHDVKDFPQTPVKPVVIESITLVEPGS